jgi:hypothetical protein
MRVEEVQDEIDDADLVPLISSGLIILALFASGLDYYYIRRGASLLFYAVLVQMWTIIESGSRRGAPSYWEFLITSAGAVIVGYGVELIVEHLSGEMIAAQSLALAIVVSRLYVNRLRSESLKEALQWENPIDRYVILIPCSVAILLPIVLFQVTINPILGFDPNAVTNETRDAFLTLVLISILTGVLLYGRIEEDWSLGS